MRLGIVWLLIGLTTWLSGVTELPRNGWNLIAVCQDMNRSEINMNGILEIQAQDGRTIYTDENSAYSNLTELQSGYAYWIKGANGVTFDSGESIYRIQQPLQRNGWNLMASCDNRNAEDINMSGIDEVQDQDGHTIYTGSYAKYSDLDQLQNGYGYWIKGDSGTLFTAKEGLSIPAGFIYDAINNKGEAVRAVYNDYIIELYADYNETADYQANHIGIFIQLNGVDIDIPLHIQNSYLGKKIIATVYDRDGKLIGVTEAVTIEGNTVINIETVTPTPSVDDNSSNESNSSISEKMGVLIPLFVYPEEDSWRDLINAKLNHPEIEMIAIVNQSNGHFTAIDPNYQSYIPMLTEVGIKVIGYVSTQYGARAIEEVKADMNYWKAFYQSGGVQGFFFDETSKHGTEVAYYKELTAYADSIGLGLTVLNGGTTVSAEYFYQNVADIIVTYEESYNHWQQYFRTGYIGSNQPDADTDIALMMHSVSTVEMMQEVVAQSQQDGFGYLYITPDGSDGDPWDSIANYMDQEVQELLAHNRLDHEDSGNGSEETNGTMIVKTIETSADDVEQQPISGAMSLESSDLELVHEGEDQLIGLRFTQLKIPQGAKITRAYIQFNVKELEPEDPTNLNIYAENIGNAPIFTPADFDVSNRTKTTQSVSWNVPHWAVVNERGIDQQTPDLSPVVQAIVDREDWQTDNAMAFIIEGTGKRTATAYDLDPSRAATLYINYDETNATDTNSSNTGDNPTDTNSTGSTKLGTLIPMYVYPDLHKTESEWQRLFNSKMANPDIDMIVIANPSNGHFSTMDSLYASVISQASEIGIKVVGYVYTQYGARDINVVKEDIDYWTAFYKDLGVIGIFFDETEGREAQGKRPYYAELTQYIKSQGYDLSILNPGITADQTFVDNYTADIIVSFESYYTSYVSDFKTGNVGKTIESDLTSTALMIHDMDTLANLKQVISDAPADGFDYVYITSGDKGWRTLGVDWDTHVSELLKYERD